MSQWKGSMTQYVEETIKEGCNILRLGSLTLTKRCNREKKLQYDDYIRRSVTANGSHSKETETEENGQTTTAQTVKRYLGVGIIFGAISVFDGNIQLGVKVQVKKNDEH